MHRKVAGEFYMMLMLNGIKIAGSDIVARLRYHTEDTCILSCEQMFTFQGAPGRSRYEGLPEDEDGKGQGDGGGRERAGRRRRAGNGVWPGRRKRTGKGMWPGRQRWTGKGMWPGRRRTGRCCL